MGAGAEWRGDGELGGRAVGGDGGEGGSEECDEEGGQGVGCVV